MGSVSVPFSSVQTSVFTACSHSVGGVASAPSMDEVLPVLDRCPAILCEGDSVGVGMASSVTGLGGTTVSSSLTPEVEL